MTMTLINGNEVLRELKEILVEAAAWLAEPDARLLRAARDDLLVATPVSLRVSSIRHDDPDCLGPPRNVQLSLF